MSVKAFGEYITKHFKQGFLINRLMKLYSLTRGAS